MNLFPGRIIKTHPFSGINFVDVFEYTRKMKSRDLKKLSILIAKRLFAEYDVKKGLEAMIGYKPKLDDVSDVFCQSFSVYLEESDFTSKSRKLV